MDLIALREAFNIKLLNIMSSSILQDSVFGWGGYGKTIFSICFIVALFQSFVKSEKEMLVEWTKIVFASWFALAILGQEQANWQKVFPFLGNGASLDIAVFNYAKGTFDSIGKEMSKKEGGAFALEKYSILLNSSLSLFAEAVMDCDPENTQCIKDKMTQKLPPIDENKEEENKGFFSNPMSTIANILMEAYNLAKRVVTNPLIMFFPIFMVILQVIRGIVEMFMLITFGMITAIMLMLTKALCPLMILPAYRGRIISLFKTTLSTSLYGFVSHLILWLSIVLTKALYMTTGEFFVEQVSNISAAGAASLYFLVITNFFTSLVILAMQAAAIAKIPKICRQIMNLSVEEIVNIGETLLQAGIGMAKVAGAIGVGLLSGGAALAAGGLASTGAMAGQAGGAMGGMLNTMGKGANMANSLSQRMGFDGFIPKNAGGTPFGAGMGGKRSPASQLLSGGGGGGGSGDAGRDMALGGANSGSKSDAGSVLKKNKSKIAGNATDKPRAGVIAEDSGEDEKSGGKDDDKKTELQLLQDKEKAGVLSVGDKKEKGRLDLIKSTAGLAGTMVGGKDGLKSVLSKTMDMAEEGAYAGLGSGDGLGAVKSLAGTVGSKESNQALFEVGQKMTSRTRTAAEVAATSEQALNTISNPQAKMSFEQNQSYDALAQQIQSGEATDDDRLKYMQMSNKYALSQDQQSSYDTLSKKDTSLARIVKQETTVNNKIIQALEKGKASDKQLMEFNQRVESGMMNVQSLGGNNSLKKNLAETTKDNYEKALERIEERYDKNKSLDSNDRQQLNMISKNTSRAIMGDGSALDTINKVSDGAIKTEHLRMGGEESAKNVSKFLTTLAGSQSQSQVTQAPQYAKLADNLEVAFDANGDVEGILVDGQVVTSPDELRRVSDKGPGYTALQSFMAGVNNFEVRDKITDPFAKRMLDAGTQSQLVQYLKNLKK